MNINQADQVARTILTQESFGGGRFRPRSGRLDQLEGREVVKGYIYRYPQLNTENRDVALTIYMGLGELGARMWEQEIRVLQRIGVLEHPSLPRLGGGGYVPAGATGGAIGAGYVRTEIHISGEDDPAAMGRYFHENQEAAVRTLWRLADGLAVLHDSRIAHRNLWPGTLEYEQIHDGKDDFRVQLARFEMSSMVSNLLRAGQVDSAGADLVRPIYLNQNRRSHAYTPPERTEFLLGQPESNGAGEFPGDVFALGTIAAEWLLGPDLLDNPPDLGPELLEFQREVRHRVRAATELPPVLTKLIVDMLDPYPRGRPTMTDVMSALSRNYAAVLPDQGDADGADKPYLIAYMRNQSDRTLLSWKRISDSATTDEGRAQLVDLIEQDLREATVCHSTDGAVPFVRIGAENRRKRAKTVMFGKEFIWFTETLYQKRMGAPRYFDNIQVIKYVIQRHRAPRRLMTLQKGGLTRTVFAVEAVDSDASAAELDRLSEGRPSWKYLVQSTAQANPLPTVLQDYLNALDWFIEYQQAQLSAREYAYVREGDQAGTEQVAVRWDRARDSERAYTRSTMVQKITSDERLRAQLADFVAEAVAESPANTLIEVIEDTDGVPGERVGEYRLVETTGREIVVLDVAHRPRIPERGWLRISRDRATWTNLKHQALAVEELAKNQVLLRSLHKPVGIQANPVQWRHAGGKLSGEGRHAVRSMLENQAMFALQGPPGTGKTEVSSQAVAEYLRENPHARVLISAQSHDALDNLATRVLAKIGAVDDRGRPVRSGFLPLRVASDWTKRSVSGPAKEFLADQLVPRLQEQIRTAIADPAFVKRFDRPGIPEILRLWQQKLPDAEPELRARVRRGANVVFATTGASTRFRLVEQGSSEPFDWVVVEEAAKAWPTELAMPLVRGLRWTLVGDQAQIGAFARRDVERFLDSCRDDPNEDIASWWEMRDILMRVFDTFGGLFTDDRTDAPRLELTEQRRMRAPIAQVVSDGFYAARVGGGLKTMRPDTDHGLFRPAFLQGMAVVWVDTGETQQAAGFWCNEVESNLVARLVRSFQPVPVAHGAQAAHDLAIITPYRKQVDLIQQRLTEHADKVWTVDSFQGREARVVVASLVRDRDSRYGAHGEIGHLAEPGRANVLLSRARDLLVLVGRLSQFENCGVPEWEAVVSTIRQVGHIVPMSRVVGQ